MKIVFYLCVVLCSFPVLSLAGVSQIPIQSIEGKKITLGGLKGKAILVVNIATRCGYTPQLKGLEALYKKYQKQGLVIVGVPSNDFGEQTPEKNGDVKKFCKLNYEVSFPLTEKLVVKGPEKHPLFRELVGSSPTKKDIRWNFEKFLLNRNGKLVERFQSADKPMGAKLVKAIENELVVK